MRKLFLSIVAAVAVLPALAGGFMTNTNQSAAFQRSVARGTTLDSDAVYYNPAGTVFMADGWHFGISDQMAYQTRSTTSTFAPFAMGVGNNGKPTKKFEGDVFSALIPSFHLTWKKNRWAVMAGMGVNGGGGSIEYPNGLASFERQFAAIPMAISQFGQTMNVSANQYSMDMLLQGKSMTLAFNIGAAFRITDWLSIAAQLRIGSTSNGYKGHIKDIMTNPNALVLNPALNGQNMVSVSQFMLQTKDALTAMGMMNPEMEAMLNTYAVQTANHTLDVKQTGISFSPIVALAFHKGNWDVTAKYEFEMPTTLKIKSAAVSANDPVINSIFPNGAEVKSETPALLAVAASRWCGPVKVTLEWHHFFDKQAENSFTPAVLGNTNEYLAGVEWQISKRWLVSAGAQRTQFNLDENKYSDMNFAISSWTAGLGLAFNITDAIRLNAGFMKTFYDKDIISQGIDAATGLEFKDVYNRTSTSWGIGLDFYFGKKNLKDKYFK